MISPLAIVNSHSKIGDNVRIDPFAIVDSDVHIGDNVWIGSHAVIKSGTRIGSGSKIYEGAIVGGDPQDLKYKGEQTYLIIGERVRIREFCTINRGTAAAINTVIEDDVLIMAYSHIAHDCHIRRGAIVANNVQVAGHVDVGSFSVIGGMSAVQQFIKVGKHAYIGGGTLIRKDVPPFIKAAQEPLRYAGTNKIGLKRHNVSDEDIRLIEQAAKLLFVIHDNTSIATNQIKAQAPHPMVQELVRFVEESPNGIIKGMDKRGVV